MPVGQTNPFKDAPPTTTSPGRRHFSITPSDSVPIPIRPKALYIVTESGGDLAIIDEQGVSITYAVKQGVFPFSPVFVKATGTTVDVIGWI